MSEFPRWCDSYEVDQIFTCQDPDTQNDGVHGCDVGCNNVCPDRPEFLKWMAASVLGRRWMRPAPETTNRAANGEAKELHSNQTLRVPPLVRFQRAQCWRNAPGLFAPTGPTEEYFDMDICDCHPLPGADEEDQYEEPPGSNNWFCEEDVPDGAAFHQLLPDCEFYKRHGWKPPGATGWMYCRGTLDHEAKIVTLDAGRLFQSMFCRTAPCTTNRLVMCTARVAMSTCDSGYIYDDPPPTWYDADPCRIIQFDTVLLNYGADEELGPPVILTGDYIPLQDEMLTELKNAVIEHVRTEVFQDGSANGVRFDRLDYQLPIGGTSDLGWWKRGWSGRDFPPESPDLPVVAEFPESFRLYSRETVHDAEMVIIGVDVQLDLVAHRKCHRHAYFDGSFVPCDHKTFPHARFRIRANTAMRVLTLDGEYVLDPISTDDPYVFVDEHNRRLNGSLSDVWWWGFLGDSSDPRTANVERDEFPLSITGQCRALAEDLGETVIPGWPYALTSQPDDRNRIYGGAVGISFPECEGEPGPGGAVAELIDPAAFQPGRRIPVEPEGVEPGAAPPIERGPTRFVEQ
jgi:hypothetical protein